MLIDEAVQRGTESHDQAPVQASGGRHRDQPAFDQLIPEAVVPHSDEFVGCDEMTSGGSHPLRLPGAFYIVNCEGHAATRGLKDCRFRERDHTMLQNLPAAGGNRCSFPAFGKADVFGV